MRRLGGGRCRLARPVRTPARRRRERCSVGQRNGRHAGDGRDTARQLAVHVEQFLAAAVAIAREARGTSRTLSGVNSSGT